MSDDVPPRVIPLFINELATSPPETQELHIKHFIKALPAIFQARVVEEDIADLFVALCSLCRAPRSVEPVVNGAVPALSAVRLLLELLDVQRDHSVLSLRVVQRMFERLLRKRDQHANKAAAGLHLVVGDAGHSGRDVDAMTSRSETTQITATNASQQRMSSPNRPGPQNHRRGDFEQEPVNTMVRSAEASGAMTALQVDALLQHPITRGAAYALLELLDRSGCDLSLMTAEPNKLHLYFPHRFTSNVKVYRDFAFCTPRPKLKREWGPVATIHVKTNIPAKSEVMYRFLVEGYNYGVNAPIFSDAVGYTNRNWEELGKMSKYGWPEGWDDTATNNYAPGVSISQYFSSDDFVVLRLQAKSLFSAGFGVSAWLCFHGMGNGFPVAATIHHQDADL
ncbi:Hypothetical protein, putative [Bodo saltans]|uniref:Uncharacterized protein n=1 Tax=Bodo saltans TaxID=75058 RepID=A0A0S4ISY1_BODSA|nr:Hypothetical protein, putative [Bodo saltans]|eukprot:CUG06277.1 Hypothetical protein, putative [Bodo saltans]